MAKKSVSENVEPKKKNNLFSLIKKVDNSVEMIEEATMSKIGEWIDTGNYMLNASLSGSLRAGYGSGRILVMHGESQSGKTWVACSMVRAAQKQKYHCLWLDSEAAMTSTFAQRCGINTEGDNFMTRQVTQVNEVTELILNICNSVIEARQNGDDPGKLMIVLDSLGGLSNSHESESLDKVDLSRSKDIRKLFRICTMPLAKADIPLIVINHTYSTIGSYISQNTMGGGQGTKYASTFTLFLSGSKLVDKENDKAAAKAVGASNVKKTGIKVSVKCEKSRYCIPHTIYMNVPMYAKINPWSGIEEYLNYENAGIAVGVVRTQEEYDKMKPAEQAECHPFEYTDKETGEIVTRYAIFKKAMTRGVGIICKHLGRHVTLEEFYSPICFTEEFIDYIDTNIIRPEFELPTHFSADDEIADLTRDLGLDDEDDTED